MKDFDLRAYLVNHTRVQDIYENEYIIQCECDRKYESNEWHLWVNVKKQMGVCYRCKKSLRDLLDIIRFVEGLSLVDAERRIRELYGPAVRLRQAVAKLKGEEIVGDEEQPMPREIELPDEFLACRPGRKLPSYFSKRRITPRIAKTYRLGWCEFGYYSHRLIIPVDDSRGELQTFVARWMSKTIPQGIKKVLYPKGSKISQLLFNHHRALDHDTIIITEGVFDAIRVGTNAVALLGKHASRSQFSMLVELGEKRKLVVMLDADAVDDALELAEDLCVLCNDVRLARLEKGVDPGASSHSAIQRVIRRSKPVRYGAARLDMALSRI